MILLTNGDSWTQGDSPAQTPNWEATKTLDWYDIIPNFGDETECSQRILYKFYDSPVWPKVLGEKLGVETWNAGRLGTSNQTIFRTTINSINYLREIGENDIFVVIAWTTKYRNEIWKPNGLYDTFQFADSPTWESFFSPGDVTEFRFYFQKMMTFYVMDMMDENKILYDYLYCVLNLQNFLKQNNIKYLFFNAFDDPLSDFWMKHHLSDIDKREDTKREKKYWNKTESSKHKKDMLQLYDYLDLTNFYNNDCGNHFRKYIEDKFDVSWRPPKQNDKYFINCHPTNLSHGIWSDHLYEYIVNNLEK